MSPLLVVSLVLIFALWVIPFAWAVSAGLRELPRLVGDLIEFFRNAPNLMRMSEGERQLLRMEVRFQSEYEVLQSELSGLRDRCSSAVRSKRELLKKVKRLTSEIRDLEKILHPSKTQLEKNTEARKLLSQMEKQLAGLEFQLVALRLELSDKEAAVQKAYTRMQVEISAAKADYACKIAQRIFENTEGTTDARIRKLEAIVMQHEVEAYSKSYIAVSEPGHSNFVDSILQLPIGALNLDELRELLEATSAVSVEISSSVIGQDSYLELLRMQLAAAEAELDSWKRKVVDAAAENKPLLVKQAEVNQLEREVQIGKLRLQLKESSNKSAEVKLLEMKLSKRKGEILMRIADLESEDMDFSPGEA